jgi:hypothetical protein
VGSASQRLQDVGRVAKLGGEESPRSGSHVGCASPSARSSPEHRTLARATGHVRPAHAFLDVQAARLAGDSGVFRTDAADPRQRCAGCCRSGGSSGVMWPRRRAPGEPIERDPGGSLNEKMASGSATTRSGAQPRIAASPARWCLDSRRRALVEQGAPRPPRAARWTSPAKPATPRSSITVWYSPRCDSCQPVRRRSAAQRCRQSAAFHCAGTGGPSSANPRKQRVP